MTEPLLTESRMTGAAPSLLTDLYQLTMLQAYVEEGLTDTAEFEFHVRDLPPARNFLVAAGLEQVLDYLENLRFGAAELEWLAASGRFHSPLLEYLKAFRFTGDVDAMPEGTVCFADEPLLRVRASLPQAQFVESRLINLVHFQTMIASKAARMVLAAPDKQLVDFGLRRAHGAEAGLLAARASYLAGFAGTATVLAGMLWDVPLFGTMAHSFIQSHDREAAAFERFAEANPADVTLLLDTYDTEQAAREVVALAEKLSRQNIAIHGVRLDSGDLAEHARRVRRILDAAGLAETKIVASGNLDEYQIARLLACGAPIDGFGVGTRMDVSADAPYLDCAYKLQAYAGRPRRKRSEGKATWPGRKQVIRRVGGDGRMIGDDVVLDAPTLTGGLLVPVMRAGRRLGPAPRLSELRARTLSSYARLPAPLRFLEPAPPYEVRVADSIRQLAAELDRQSGASSAPPP